jgi:integrase
VDGGSRRRGAFPLDAARRDQIKATAQEIALIRAHHLVRRYFEGIDLLQLRETLLGLADLTLAVEQHEALTEIDEDEYVARIERNRSTTSKGARLTRANNAQQKQGVHGMLHKALADAVRWGRLVRNAADAADQPRKSSPEMQVWTPEQMRSFLEHVRDDRLFAAWQLLSTTGMRRGELLGLRWADIDFERGSLAVRQVHTAVNYTVETGTPKTHKGSRTVSLDPATLAALRSHRRQQNEERLVWGGAWTETGLVFVRADGDAIHPQRLSQWFAQHVRRAGLPKIRLHDVRHSYATAVIRAGVPHKVVSQRIGHANPTITMTTYQHVLPGDDEQAALIGARAILGTP